MSLELQKKDNVAAPRREEMHLGHDNRFAFVGDNSTEKSPPFLCLSEGISPVTFILNTAIKETQHVRSVLYMTMRNALGWKSTLTDTCILIGIFP